MLILYSGGFIDFEKILRSYDIRGLFGVDLLLGHALILGRALGREVTSSVVGYDSRQSSVPLSQSLIKGLLECSCEVINIGLCSTPMMNFAHRYFHTEAAIMVTASHNPANYNGFKIVKNNLPMEPYLIKQMLTSKLAPSIYNHKICHVIENNILDVYIHFLLRDTYLYKQNKRLKIIWDAAYCTASFIIQKLILHLPWHEHIIIHDTINGLKYADNSDLANLALLREQVILQNADLGFYFDTDVDRISVIAREGQVISVDTILMFILHDILNKGQFCHNVVLDYKMSNKLTSFLEEKDIKCLFCRTGHSFIKRQMKENQSTIGAESSGHIFWGCDANDDALYTALRLINIMAEGGNFSDMPDIYVTPEIRLNIVGNFEILARLNEQLLRDGLYFIDVEDGFKVILDIGWWVIRISGTENKVVIRAEANNSQELNLVKEHLSLYLTFLEL